MTFTTTAVYNAFGHWTDRSPYGYVSTVQADPPRDYEGLLGRLETLEKFVKELENTDQKGPVFQWIPTSHSGSCTTILPVDSPWRKDHLQLLRRLEVLETLVKELVVRERKEGA